jgi:capsular polysaccharide biosynthesis protein
MVLNAVRRGWWVVAAVVAAAIGASIAITAAVTPVYRAETLMVVTPHSSVQDSGDILKSLETLERRTVVATFARIATTQETREAAAAAAGLNPERSGDFRVEASVLPSTNIIRIEVEGENAAATASLANQLGTLTARSAESMYRIYTISTLASATAPRSPVRPDKRRNYLVAITAGALIGLVAAFVLEHLRRSGEV